MKLARFRRGVWRHPAFVRLWAAESISSVGDQVTLLAIPLLAVTTLHAGSEQMGVLRAAETGPVLVIGLFAGVWIDRLRRRPILIASDIGRAVLLLAIPIAAWLDLLRIELLYGVGILVGTLTVFFEVARQSYVTSVVDRSDLVEANSKLAISNSGAEVAGPGLAGVLVQLLGAPTTILADAVSFVFSGAFIARIRTPESPPKSRAKGSNIWREMREGMTYVIHDPILRTLAGAVAVGNLFENARYAVLILYMSKELDLKPGAIGLILAVGSIGYFLGAFFPDRLAKRFGLGRTIVGGATVLAITDFLYPFAAGPNRIAVPILIAAIFIGGFAVCSYDVNQFSLRQAITPEHLLGRVNARARVIIRGAVPIGALLGGFVGEVFGLRAALFVGALSGITSLIWVLRSPIPALREPPERNPESGEFETGTEVTTPL